MNADDHSLNLGRLWANLQSLEATIRIFLTRTNPSKNYMIGGPPLGPLIDKYNGQLSKAEQSLYSVNTTVVDIRNALAYGLVIAPRNSTLKVSLPLTLYHKGQWYEMTLNWFQDQQMLVQAQHNRILACANKHGIS
jgi:hypothetical protein